MESRVGRRVSLHATYGALTITLLTFGASAAIATPARGAVGSPPGIVVRSMAKAKAKAKAKAAPTTTAPHTKKRKKTRKKATTTTRGAARSAAAAKALLDAYCRSVSADGGADVTLFDTAMRPILTRAVSASGLHTTDPTLAADATTLLNSVTASLSTASLAQVPTQIRTDVQTVRAEKQAILQHVVGAANGTEGLEFLLDATNTGGGVLPQLRDITTFLQTNCAAGTIPGAPTAPT